ncbi:hypothetical protein DYB34_005103 [Aphanomyces astaci]|uniref:WASH complex, subunit CCDC53 n=3 Tax=Aphanomyces astaci TaxID=112090 RepID=A0A418CD63_APHAT|nr:hypothetical protein DYB34_005103 [Aphanomyces astaci]
MAESDSDDELMRALQGHGQPEECAYCQTEGATFPCTKCNSVVESESEYEDDDDDDEEEEKADALNRRRSGRGSALFRGSSQVFQSTHTCIYLWNAHESVDGSGSMMIPGLTEEQIAQLVKLSSKSTDVLKSSNEISGLKAQLEEMMKSQVNMQELAGRVTTMQQTQETQQQQQQQASSTSSTLLQKSASLKQHELEKLMHKLEALEQRANFSGGGAPPTSSSSSTMPPMMMMMPPPPPVVIYTPLLVQNDDKFKKYFKLLKMAMPVDQIKAKMEVEGVPPALLDTPTAISPNDPGAPPGAYLPLTVGEDPKFKKYFKLQEMHIPVDQIKMKMEAEGLDPDLLDHPEKVSPHDPGPPAVNGGGFAFPGAAPALLQPVAAPYIPLLVKDDPAFKKYFKLMSMGMPVEQVELKMKAEGFDASVLATPDAVSPNDPGVRVDPSLSMGIDIASERRDWSAGAAGGSGMRTAPNGDGGAAPVRSVKDQMAAELAAASDAVHDIFGEDTVKATGGGMTMVEQLEKKARKDLNKKLVDNIDAINTTIQDLLTVQFTTEAVCCLDTRDWYFNEQQRMDAGHAYLRLWSLSTLANDVSQLTQKYDQIVNAPVVLSAQNKNKIEVIDKFTNLLKDAVKLKHKIFKNKTYDDELARMATLNIPQEYDKHGDELIDAAAILAAAALDFADEELRVLDKTVRAKKIRASATVHVGEKAAQLVGIVNKLGARGMDAVNARMGPLDEQLNAIKEQFFADKDEEEEDDVL